MLAEASNQVAHEGCRDEAQKEPHRYASEMTAFSLVVVIRNFLDGRAPNVLGLARKRATTDT